MRTLIPLGLAILLALQLAASVARAQQPSPKPLTGEAKAAYDSGAILYRDGDYAGACLKFRRAYELSQDHRLLWNEAACEKNQRHYARALDLLRRYLAEGGAEVTASEREQVQLLMRTMSEFVCSLQLDVQPPGARVTIDGLVRGRAPFASPLTVDHGPRQVKVELEGYEPLTEVHNLPGGASHRLDIRLKRDVQVGLVRVSGSPEDAIFVDGKQVGVGRWQGSLTPGVHSLRVTAPGKQPFEDKVEVKRDQINSTHVALRLAADSAHPSGPPRWLYALGGIGIVAAVGITAYFATRSDPADPGVGQGSMSPGRVEF